MKKPPILSCALLLAVALFAPGCKKKEDASDKEQKSEVKVSAEETAGTSDGKTDEAPTEKAERTSEERTSKASEEK